MKTTLGTVWLPDFDRGVIESMGANTITVVVDGSPRAQYVLALDGVHGPTGFEGKVPVFFENPEDPYQKYVLPCIVVKRSGMNPAYDRSPSVGNAWRLPAPGANPVSIPYEGKVLSGYDQYREQWLAEPYDINYEVQLRCRKQLDFMRMLKHALKLFRAPSFTVTVKDSEGETRGYDAVNLDVTNNSDLSGVVNRTITWSATFDVRGELDIDDPMTSTALTAVPNVTTELMK